MNQNVNSVHTIMSTLIINIKLGYTITIKICFQCVLKHNKIIETCFRYVLKLGTEQKYTMIFFFFVTKVKRFKCKLNKKRVSITKPIPSTEWNELSKKLPVWILYIIFIFFPFISYFPIFLVSLLCTYIYIYLTKKLFFQISFNLFWYIMDYDFVS